MGNNLSAREQWAKETGRPKEEFPGYTIPGSDKLMSSDAKKAMDKLSSEAQEFILSQDFGSNLSANEVDNLKSKWINASKSNSSTIENLSTSKLPAEAFNVTVPQLVPGTPEYQAALDKLSTAYFDVIQQQLNASTEQEQSAAEYNWQTLKKSIEKNLNLSLSNDAFQAWNQIQGVKSQYGQQNLTNSGLQNETIDNYLNSLRRSEAVVRSESQTKADSSQQDYYTKFATPDQIKKLVATNPAQAKAWGLIPSDEIKNSMNAAALKAKYPNMSDEEIQRNIASVLDANGNYRSALYQKYMTGGSLGANMGAIDSANIVRDQYGNEIAVPVKPTDTGYQDIEAAKKQYLTMNAPLANMLKDYKSKVALGQIKPTSGADSGTAAGTQFNNVPSTDGSLPDIKLSTPKINPGSMLSSAS